MSRDLEYITGVSWPRSGHHLLVRILRKYFRKKFRYCDYYTSVDCCRMVPCVRSGVVNLSKNHDYRSVVPIVDNGKYIIQYREFSPSVVSNYEIYLRRNNKDNDTANEFHNFAMREAKTYVRFMKRWSSAVATNTTFVRISYEQLTNSPVATMGLVVNTFSPSLPCDEKRLTRSIQSAKRKTVRGGVGVVDPVRGVLATRDVQSFRFYDETLFRTLDRLTRPAYDEMAELPAITRTNGLKTRPGVTGVSEPDHGNEAKQLYIDATGMLESVSNTPTGISRVQTFIVRRAVEDPDVHAVTYDRQVQAFRNLTDAEKILLTMGPQSGLTTERLKSASKLNLFSTALRLAIENPLLAKDIDRRSAATIADPKSAGASYSFLKNTKRAYRYYRRALDVSRRRIASKHFEVEDLRNGILLSPDIMVAGSHVPEGMPATQRRAFICHDLIPWRHPEFLNDPTQGQLIVSRLMKLLETGAQVLCTSDTSRAMLQEFLDELGNPTVRIDQFRPPSILYETAQSLGRISRLYPEEPFVIYCSTIEARANHLILAKVWKQAHDEGVVLPKLVCVGEWGSSVEELRNFLNAHPYLTERIEFLGPVNDFELIDLYRSALFGVVPSFAEGWGYGASECLDFWLPVIVSTAPALMEAVQGLMPTVSPSDQDGWLAQVRRLTENKADLADLTRSIVEHYQPIESQESWNTIRRAIAEYS